MAKKAKQTPPLMLSPAVCSFPSPAEQYVDAPLDLNELLVKNPPATYIVRAALEHAVVARRNADRAGAAAMRRIREIIG